MRVIRRVTDRVESRVKLGSLINSYFSSRCNFSSSLDIGVCWWSARVSVIEYFSKGIKPRAVVGSEDGRAFINGPLHFRNKYSFLHPRSHRRQNLQWKSDCASFPLHYEYLGTYLSNSSIPLLNRSRGKQIAWKRNVSLMCIIFWNSRSEFMRNVDVTKALESHFDVCAFICKRFRKC